MDEASSQSERPEAAESPAFVRGTSGSIRRARPEDAAALARVAAATFPLACPPHVTTDAIAAFIAAHLSASRFDAYLADPARQVLLLEVREGDGAGVEGGVDAAAVGYAMVVHVAPSDPDVLAAIGPAQTTELSKLYLMPDHHGSGLASELMDAAVALAVARGSSTIWLGVNQENERANRFYAKHGFEIAGPKRFLVGDRYEHDWVRVRQLSG